MADASTNNRTGLYPDALLPATHGNMLPLTVAEAQPYWVQLHDLQAPASDEGEIYATVIIATITAAGAQPEVSLTVKVLLWDFVVPAPANASQALGAKFNEELPIFLGKNQFVDNDLFDEYAFENWAEHRVNSYIWMPVGGVSTTLTADLGAVTLNTTSFDSRVAWLLGHGVRDIRFPIPSGSNEWLQSTIDGDWTQSHSLTLSADKIFGPALSKQPGAEASLLTVPVFLGTITHATLNPQFVTLFKLVNGAIVKHLLAKGWLGHIVAEFVDEPHFNASAGELDRELLKNYTAAQLNNFTRFAVTAVSRLWKGLHPQLRLQQTGDDPATLNDPNMRQVGRSRWQLAS